MTRVDRFGVELELLAPSPLDRRGVAAALAEALRPDHGDVVVTRGFKHRVDGEQRAPQQDRGVPRCLLSERLRVSTADGRWLLDLVDDPTIRDHVAAAPGVRGERDHDGDPDGAGIRPLVIADDTRLSLWLADHCWAPIHARPWAAVFDAARTTFGAEVVASDDGAVVVDRYGQVLAVVTHEPAAHHRVVEVVTAPLPRHERDALLRTVLTTTGDLGCTVPSTAALHLHLDAAPFADAHRLAALIVGWNADVDGHREALGTNPRCLKLGAFPKDAVRVAESVRSRTDPLPFRTVATAWRLAGVDKALDLNLRGVLDERPVQPTLEIRCLPMALNADAVIATLDRGEALVRSLAGLSAP